MGDQAKILSLVNSYYSNKVIKYGSTPKGVDWNSIESQEIRFSQLIKLIDKFDGFSLLDFGAGYGALYRFLLTKGAINFKYSGYDISQEMISKGKELLGESASLVWLDTLLDDFKYDYTIASGLFNVKMEINYNEWERYIYRTLNEINECSINGFSFNMLTSYSDKVFMQDYLYYAAPEKVFAYCKNNFSKDVALLHDYNLYEFTIVVRKL